MARLRDIQYSSKKAFGKGKAVSAGSKFTSAFLLMGLSSMEARRR
jgi:hypothetical protein